MKSRRRAQWQNLLKYVCILAQYAYLLILEKGFGIQPHEVVLNFIEGRNSHVVHEQELEPLSYADQFVDPDPTKALSPDELLRRARMIFATELGKDPLLRQEMRNRFKRDALVSVHHTERGFNKIDEHHPYFVRLFVVIWINQRTNLLLN